MSDKNSAQAQPEGGNGEAQAETQRPDPFANLPTVKLNTVEVLDLSGVACSNARKYEKTHTAAVGAKLPIQPNWKYSTAIFVPGAVKKEFRAGSVFGTIADIVGRSGRQGIASYQLATELRRAQVGNKRSHFCEAVPPVGWAEGYINSAVTQGIISVHGSRKADPLVAPPAPAADAGDGKGTGTNG